jgi:adenylyltransferase/sulfurtransferase
MIILSSEELTRYHRQIIIPEIGEEGQKKLKSAGVFISGLGGLGSLSAYYLVSAGIGRLEIAEKDRVEAGNLNRQILHFTDDIGKPKAESAMEKLERLNPACRIEPFRGEVLEENVVDLVRECSLIVDGTDNYRTRRYLNLASIRKGIPFIFGGVDGFDGMVSTFIPGQTPCFECLFPEKEYQEKTPGVLGPVAGLVASIQVLEAIKYLVGLDGLLKGRLLLIHGSDMTFRQINLERNPDCPVCYA